MTTNCNYQCPVAYDCIIWSLHTVINVPEEAEHALIPDSCGLAGGSGRAGCGAATRDAVRRRVPQDANMRYPMGALGRGAAGSALGGRPETSVGRLAQRESASFTPRRSLVRSQYRPPSSAASYDLVTGRPSASGSSKRQQRSCQQKFDDAEYDLLVLMRQALSTPEGDPSLPPPGYRCGYGLHPAHPSDRPLTCNAVRH
jgi:hypothetical protein